ncbi:hypothetical protein ACRS6Y_12600 [Bacillus cytotoxicus]|uniref:Transporter n=1 Tax=Bacillus cytotoxicus (strain DSM 22905 / CIP 110041 / 391-98 / NVH 391-98) TaxID=315749 RepID=A7GPG0_BACCN|nr:MULTISPECIES: hypothetical protein [Bacillus cereus group]ABS22018.1 conserved hypothetical protein [Bacillus cytotoxicus NVH 391-98]MDH2860119.1 hypothetical protein [Bacillus cytotoxicus]MDH2864213.1 hypothetical protein [Bacillus cytotoxicus]MDH2867779.1 hypothetical protein [Bacillus cytotoxicus]MDH2872233.1 hypothetical protein [Bacillus cytotoxicus]
MKHEEVFKIEISVGSELVAKHEMKAYDVIDVIEKLAHTYLDNDKERFDEK